MSRPTRTPRQWRCVIPFRSVICKLSFVEPVIFSGVAEKPAHIHPISTAATNVAICCQRASSAVEPAPSTLDLNPHLPSIRLHPPRPMPVRPQRVASGQPPEHHRRPLPSRATRDPPPPPHTPVPHR